jgi:hypothetical protein
MKSRAVIFGLDYSTSENVLYGNALYGCVNDATNIATCLHKLGLYDQIDLYTDKVSTTYMSILDVLTSLAADTTLSRVFIFFAGHGTQLMDVIKKDDDEEDEDKGDETDGEDECIVPSDFWDECNNQRPEKLISDDILRVVLSRFAKDTKVTALFDCCHSGTICDLRYVLNTIKGTYKVLENYSECAADITVISSCLDIQPSYEEIRAGNSRPSGVFTSRFIEYMYNMTTTSPIDCTTIHIASAIYNMMKDGGYLQVPVVTSSRALDETSRLFMSTPTEDNTDEILSSSEDNVDGIPSSSSEGNVDGILSSSSEGNVDGILSFSSEETNQIPEPILPEKLTEEEIPEKQNTITDIILYSFIVCVVFFVCYLLYQVVIPYLNDGHKVGSNFL